MTLRALIGLCFISMVSVSQLQAQVPTAPTGPSSLGSVTAAPKPGHPLDQRDVDILTGKADAQRHTPYSWGMPYLADPTRPLVDGALAYDSGLARTLRPNIAPGFPLVPGFLPFFSPQTFRITPPFRPFVAPRFAPFQFRRLGPLK
jgi:hypothetical protein